MSDFEITAQLKAEKTLHEILRITTAFNKTEDAVGKVSRQAAKAEREIQRAAAAVQAMNKAENVAKMTPAQTFFAERDRLNAMRRNMPEADYRQAMGRALNKYQSDELKPHREALAAMKREADAADAAMGRLAASIRKANETPFDRLKQGMLAAGEARDSKRITKDEYRAEKRRLADVFKNSDPGTLRAAADLESITAAAIKADNAMNKLAADMRKANTTPFEKYINGLKTANNLLSKGKIDIVDYNREVSRMESELNGASDSAKEAFGGGIVSMVGGYAAGVLSVSTAINAVRSAYDSFRESQKAGLAHSRSMDDTYEKLRSISNTTPEYNSLVNEMNKVATDPRIGISRQDAGDFVFKSHSLNLSEDDKKAALEARSIVKPDLSVDIISQLKANYPERFNVPGGGRKALEIALAGGKKSGLENEEIGRFLPNAFAEGRAGGFTTEQTIAAVGHFREIFGTATKAADRFGALAGKIYANPEQFYDSTKKREVKGIEAIELLIKDPMLEKDIFGVDRESISAMSARKGGTARLKEIEDEVNRYAAASGTGSGLIDEAKAIVKNDPLARAKYSEAAAKNAEDIAGERKYATKEAAFNTIGSQLNTIRKETNADGMWIEDVIERTVTGAFNAVVPYETSANAARVKAQTALDEYEVQARSPGSLGGESVTVEETRKIESIQNSLNEIIQAGEYIKTTAANTDALNKNTRAIESMFENPSAGGPQRIRHIDSTGTIGVRRDQIEKATNRQE